mmetsp:Transcript_8460/g.38172  ORF Transcript_8460/g.38172 Transcript_8460/m.38172 type:complete len:362 (+) Transcript_8460:1672-2757(+)
MCTHLRQSRAASRRARRLRRARSHRGALHRLRRRRRLLLFHALAFHPRATDRADLTLRQLPGQRRDVRGPGSGRTGDGSTRHRTAAQTLGSPRRRRIVKETRLKQILKLVVVHARYVLDVLPQRVVAATPRAAPRRRRHRRRHRTGITTAPMKDGAEHAAADAHHRRVDDFVQQAPRASVAAASPPTRWRRGRPGRLPLDRVGLRRRPVLHGLRLLLLPLPHVLLADVKVPQLGGERGQELALAILVELFKVQRQVLAPPAVLRDVESLLGAVHRRRHAAQRPTADAFLFLGNLDRRLAFGARPDVRVRVAAAIREAIRAESRRTSRALQRETPVKVHERLLTSRAREREHRLDDVFLGDA